MLSANSKINIIKININGRTSTYSRRANSTKCCIQRELSNRYPHSLITNIHHKYQVPNMHMHTELEREICNNNSLTGQYKYQPKLSAWKSSFLETKSVISIYSTWQPRSPSPKILSPSVTTITWIFFSGQFFSTSRILPLQMDSQCSYSTR